MRKIGTHSGTFHVDEALGVWMLKRLDEYKESVVVRTRDKDVLATLDIVIDVGDVYEPAKQRFDHHQRGFFEVFEEGKTTKLSSAGLVYKHFGKRVLSTLFSDAELAEPELTLVYNRVYDTFIEGIDGIDNGVIPYQVPGAPDTKVVPTYQVKTDLGSRVSRLNASWTQDASTFDSDAAFARASQLAGEEFTYFASDAVRSWLPARRLVEEALRERKSGHDEILVLSQMCPWIDHLFQLEPQFRTEVKYVVFADSNSGYRVRAVPVASGSFESRLALPEKWRGLRDGDLDTFLDIKGAVFVHASGFIGGHRTLEGALHMAQKALGDQKQ